MYDKVLHNRWSKLATAVAGAVLMAVAINLFIVPQGLYTGGLLGLCQVIRTLLVTKLGVTANFDIAGLIYLASNVPLLLLAYKTLGRTFVLRLTICTVVNSLSMSIIPVPAQPIIPDLLTSCMVGGILVGFSSGLMLTCGGSSGGMDILGLYLSKKGTGFTVGKFSLLFNAMLYTLCLLLFNAQTAIYSAIYTVFSPVRRPRASAEYHRAGHDHDQGDGHQAVSGDSAPARPRPDPLDGTGRLHGRAGAGAVHLRVEVRAGDAAAGGQ